MHETHGAESSIVIICVSTYTILYVICAYYYKYLSTHWEDFATCVVHVH